MTCTATDAHGNTAQGAFGVRVVDTTAPTVTPPANVSTEATGPLTAVAHGTATAADAVGVASLASNAPAAFPLGTTTITWTATDAAGNSASATSTVTVVDTTHPALSLPADLTREATSGNGAVASFSATADDLVDGNVGVSCAPASGSTFALGATTVACSASDLSHNTASGSFTITVVDTTKPVIAWHADVVATASANSGATVSYELPTATDLVDGTVGVSCSAGSGSWFNVGTNTVTCTATDRHGNTATSTFKVIVGYGFNGFFRPIDNGVTNIGQGRQRDPGEVQPRRQPGPGHLRHGFARVDRHELQCVADRRDRGNRDRRQQQPAVRPRGRPVHLRVEDRQGLERLSRTAAQAQGRQDLPRKLLVHPLTPSGGTSESLALPRARLSFFSRRTRARYGTSAATANPRPIRAAPS